MEFYPTHPSSNVFDRICLNYRDNWECYSIWEAISGNRHIGLFVSLSDLSLIVIGTNIARVHTRPRYRIRVEFIFRLNNYERFKFPLKGNFSLNLIKDIRRTANQKMDELSSNIV